MSSSGKIIITGTYKDQEVICQNNELAIKYGLENFLPFLHDAFCYKTLFIYTWYINGVSRRKDHKEKGIKL